ncbi:rhodanese-like domain-containing protein [Anaeromyxobacter terrae]|uniref:rhodanese-like domain-containing protein n=1 Tax=Anaeromyxobacter terrae TaxID=2925406 RepID=UPI001F56338E|nr:rhodanese-like domain-containing protein [Anaeromyxobacter sp. SG22]
MRRSSLLVLLAAPLLGGCASGPRTVAGPSPGRSRAEAAASSGVARVSGAEARRLVADGALLVDVRDPEDFAFDGIDGAVNVPAAEVSARLAELGPPGLPVIVYCETGRRSAAVARELVQLGYARVYDLGPRAAW